MAQAAHRLDHQTNGNELRGLRGFFRINACLTAFTGRAWTLEQNLWKGINAVNIACDNEGIRVAIEAEFRRFRIRVVNTKEEAAGLRVALIRAYIREMPLTRRDGTGDGTAYQIGTEAEILVQTPGGGMGWATIYNESTFGVTGQASANRVSEIARPKFIAMATEMANAYLKDNP